jgi:sugar (pentulose or hexulose) kinase
VEQELDYQAAEGVPDQDGWLVELADQPLVVLDDLGQPEPGERVGVLAELLDVAVLARPLGCGDGEAAFPEIVGEALPASRGEPGATPDPSGRVHAFCHAVPGAYHLMAVTLSAGGSLNWWRERFAGRADFEPLVAEAADVEPGADGVFLPYLTGERSPHLDPRASGAFVGLTARHGRPQLTRAIMEGVVLSMRDGLEVMRALGTAVDEVRATGGGARSPLWLQLQADVYGCPIRRTGVDEGPAYGAALLAGVASGSLHRHRSGDVERTRA